MVKKIMLMLVVFSLIFIVACSPYIYEDTVEDEVEIESGICSEFEEGAQKDNCYREWGKTQSDLEYCHSIKEEPYADFCYWGVAENEVNPGICHYISESCDILHSPHAPNCKFSCYESLIEKNTNPRNCDEIDNAFRVFCLSKFEDEELDLADCDKSGTFTEDQRYSFSKCKTLIAVQRGDESICADLGTEMNSCYYEVGMSENDTSICEMMTGGTNRDKCILATT